MHINIENIVNKKMIQLYAAIIKSLLYYIHLFIIQNSNTLDLHFWIFNQFDKLQPLHKYLLSALKPNNLFIHSLSSIHIYRYLHKLQIYSTVGENIIATFKMQNNFWYPLKMVIFSIAPHLVIALPTLR